jgi:hypothetical protein
VRTRSRLAGVSALIIAALCLAALLWMGAFSQPPPARSPLALISSDDGQSFAEVAPAAGRLRITATCITLERSDGRTPLELVWYDGLAAWDGRAKTIRAYGIHSQRTVVLQDGDRLDVGGGPAEHPRWSHPPNPSCGSDYWLVSEAVVGDS